MFRKFKFEEPLYEALAAIPLSTQFKLDRVGMRLSLKNWGRFAPEERQVLCHLPVRSQGELECYKKYLSFLLKRWKEHCEPLDPQAAANERSQWENLNGVPESVYLKALRFRVLLTPENWIELDDLERYALFRLSTEKHPDPEFQEALNEFYGPSLFRTATARGRA